MGECCKHAVILHNLNNLFLMTEKLKVHYSPVSHNNQPVFIINVGNVCMESEESIISILQGWVDIANLALLRGEIIK